MKFLLSLYLDPPAPPGGEHGHEDFLSASREAGELIGGHAFADPSTSAVVRTAGGVASVTEGPYLRAPDHADGQYLLDCDSRERALELAALLPRGRGCVEVRPLMDSAGLEMAAGLEM
ncbi:YciI family protein [Actinomadura graeca]|uniref:YciI family protein n=1 Tax=Actinomadura graeca TaxID=2750812 RepID=UPI001E4A049D|nr:YciI family protein [Actinomadura graeca]